VLGCRRPAGEKGAGCLIGCEVGAGVRAGQGFEEQDDLPTRGKSPRDSDERIRTTRHSEATEANPTPWSGEVVGGKSVALPRF
jgi:hypothetical protein